MNCELLTDEVSGALARQRLGGLVDGISINRLDSISHFYEVFLEGRSVGKAVRTRHKSLDQVLHLANRASRFREWLAGKPFDLNLAREYGASLTRGTWAEKLPSKNLRFSLFSGAGVLVDLLMSSPLSTVTGFVLGAMDTYLVDRLAKGWTPNQFVENELWPFVNSRGQ
jgi:hypothetical protein